MSTREPKLTVVLSRVPKRYSVRKSTQNGRQVARELINDTFLPRGLSESFPSSEPAPRKRSQANRLRIEQVQLHLSHWLDHLAGRCHAAFRRQSFSASR